MAIDPKFIDSKIRLFELKGAEEAMDEIVIGNGDDVCNLRYSSDVIPTYNGIVPNVKAKFIDDRYNTIVFFFDLSILLRSEITEKERDYLFERYSLQWADVGTVTLRDIEEGRFTKNEKFKTELIDLVTHVAGRNFKDLSANRDKKLFYLYSNCPHSES